MERAGALGRAGGAVNTTGSSPSSFRAASVEFVLDFRRTIRSVTTAVLSAFARTLVSTAAENAPVAAESSSKNKNPTRSSAVASAACDGEERVVSFRRQMPSRR